MQTQQKSAQKPSIRPQNPNFSSGPCSKRPGWSLSALSDATVGRSHRSKLGKAKLAEAIELSKEVLQIPSDYRLGIVPASDTGAVEMAMWTMLGQRGVDVAAWESFGKGWVTDALKQLKLEDINTYEADYGQIPDLSTIDTDRDVVFTWNGTTSGAKVPNGDWIKDDRQGLTICDATSAAFAMEIPWQKIDVLTYSWQKVMGGEAAHGVIILSPRAVERLESYTPDRPLPKIFRLTKGGKLIEGIFEGSTINTPSMICVEDAIDGLKWAKSIGGLSKLIERSNNNLKVLEDWAAKSDWIDFLVEDKSIRSNTSICLKITDKWYQSLSKEEQAAKAKELVSLMAKEEVAYDIGSYRDAPPGLRIWGGATVESKDMEALTQWLDWGFSQIKQ
ncbi:phosphoserine aminotransferase [Calothrix parasitica NIES-267]|uniref:phosphoserine transaminase n=1 Tax=Calothrix parasitica NIES-267 TaxID=1973488 RepID=A0A1Z4LQC5_9CYAN|nr:phosphoserine aminotransferase [Calothrix parasitica NIES-267]